MPLAKRLSHPTIPAPRIAIPMSPATTLKNFEWSDPRFEKDGLRQLTITTPNLGGRGDITLFVPESARNQRAVPLILLLHGVFGSHWGWALRGGAHRTAARLIAEGIIPPMLIAMPSDGLDGEGSGYVPYADGSRDFERWIVEDVPATVAMAEPCFDAQSDRFIAGLSMGGFGALRLAGKYPNRFRAASGHSSATEFEQLRMFVSEPLAKAGVQPGNTSVLETLIRNRSSLPAIRFDCGTEDILLQHNRHLHNELDRAGITHVYEEFPGGHEWPYWEKHFEETLRFFAKHHTKHRRS
jgi:S-formylglutathione hydrolase FrmB